MRPIPASEILKTVFGRLTPLHEIEQRSGKRYFQCHCICGNEKAIPMNALRSGTIASCGCIRQEVASRMVRKMNTKHGECHKSPEHHSWNAMLSRCLRPSHEAYPRYGGRGITVCDKWQGKEGFQAFLSDMGRRPSLDFTLDRIDVNGNYEPSNCRWADRVTQAKNKRPKPRP